MDTTKKISDQLVQLGVILCCSLASACFGDAGNADLSPDQSENTVIALSAPLNVTWPRKLPFTSPMDADNDGANNLEDCDDHDPRRSPYFAELCDGIDNDCDGQIDEGYHVDDICLTGNDCQPYGRVVCADDLHSTFCFFDTVGCL